MRCTLKRASQSLATLRPDVPLWDLTLEDYIDGVEMGNWPTIESLLWADDIQTLAW